MKKPATKITFLFGLYIMLHFVAASCDPDCNCANVEFPFFDYRALQVKTNNPATDKVLKIDISLDSIFFLAEASPRRGSGFITSAAACDCLGNGDRGDKFPIVSIDVFANQDFSDQLPQDSSLISLFEVNWVDIATDAPRTVYGPLFGRFDHPTRLTTASLPQNMEQPFLFTIRIIKSDGTTITAQTGEVRFQ